MTTVQQRSRPAPSGATTIRLLGDDDVGAFSLLAARSGLPGLRAPDEIVGAVGCLMLVAVADGELLGCAGMRPDVVHPYIRRTGELAAFPTPNVYLFGAYVTPAARGRGVGGLLYRRRLALAELLTAGTLVVELLGDGSPDSVHPDTVPGLHFHTSAGFREVGWSPDPDGGTVLTRTKEDG
jgi:GNAT superfamily N-acetyltransferase